MKVSRIIVISVFVILIANTLAVVSYGQDTFEIDREKLSNLIDSPETKRILADRIGAPPGVVYDMGTLAFDPFRGNVVVATLDFEYVPLAKHGTVSYAYRFVDGDYVLIYTSYWWWKTVAPVYISTNTTWTEAESPYYVTQDLWIEAGVTLTIEPGTIVRFRKTNDMGILIFLYGALVCQNATFTSSCDFENYDASQGLGDWLGIFGLDGSSFTIEDSLFEYAYIAIDGGVPTAFSVSGCTIKNCSSGISILDSSISGTVENNQFTNCDTGILCIDNITASQISANVITCNSNIDAYAGIFCRGASPVVTSNSISNYPNYGIRCIESSSPTITQNTIENCDTGVYCTSNSSPLVNNNNIEANISYGFYNDDSLITVNAENNWWGDASGPYHTTLNPSGLGNPVSDGVDFDPWSANVITAVFISLSVR
jgi:parallel beta-helix repeat protein